MTTIQSIQPALPWYRHRWPWLLIMGPAIVVVASLITAWIAATTSDGLVTEDYYKKGLAANQTIARSNQAAAFGLQAGLRVSGGRMEIRLSAENPSFPPPAALHVSISHPTRAGLDQSQVFPVQDGRYVGHFQLPAAGHWIVLLEDDLQTWRLMGNVVLPATEEIMLGGATRPADIRSQ
ncbi:hypothetical protein B9N43_05925 [Denitratisoma sp. DHT3]|uniref:FixH family protein n=1 Tax=Denitratisoma sp. DHT3 TaxID=1981880 RepID=UPI0011983D5F|nr:FixH family protein [Denitratisoma sp. DHT3]QDX80821.1 hypothetical protein B9N43_05925 [Denitratisoma sp. DHT3]